MFTYDPTGFGFRRATEWKRMRRKQRWWESHGSHPHFRLWEIKKQPENAEYFSYLGSMITNDARCTGEIESTIDMAKSSIQQEEESFHQQIGLKYKEEAFEVLHLKYSFVWCWKLDTSGSRSEIPCIFWSVVLERAGMYQLDRSCEKWRNIT